MLAKRITKEIGDTSRVDVDMTWWLDVGETISNVLPYSVTLGAPGWTTQQPSNNPPATPYDPTPVLIETLTIINGSTAVELFLEAGTPGNVYTVQFVVWGTSGRKETMEVGVQINGTVYIPPNNPAPPASQPGYVPLTGNIHMAGPLYLFEDPLAPTEATTKNYVDALNTLEIANRTAADNAEVVARNAAIVTAVATETTRATGAETTLTTNLATEVTRAEAAEASILSGVNASKKIIAGAGLNGGTITVSGTTAFTSTLTANWQGGTVTSLGTHLAITSGVLDVVPTSLISAAMAPVVSAASIDAAWLLFGQVPATGHFYQSTGAIVNRLNDRLFVGAATLQSGNAAGTGDYVTTNIPQGPTTSVAQGGAFSTIGSIGWMAGTRTSDAASLATLDGVALMSVCINDNTAGPGQGEAAYFESQQKTGAGTTVALEADVANQTGAVTQVNPYSSFATSATPYSMVFQIGAGAGRAGVSNNSSAMTLINNGAAFEKGIVMLNGALSSANEAISLASRYQVQWWVSNTQKGSYIQGSPVTANGYYGILMDDLGIHLGVSPAAGNNSVGGFNAVGVVNGVNFVQAAGAVASSPVAISSQGADTNIDLQIIPKGSGALWLGGALSTSATAGVNGATPATVAFFLTVKSSAGTTYKIPLYLP